ncbi:hypothetical protein BN946_scf184729.g3 [Trametes cinnabarina]|uniref:Uncharacterized protein n=1 Tax=Pycnoporus cinnabarinus TaxID=5643 RepID=A0A060T0N4_PYCCI|nr:hypothetical protein BN946_scf184729.g3 [Trametes cinnabarina]
MAASMQWAAVTDAVSSTTLAQVAVSSSFGAISAMGVSRFLTSRGAGGYNAHINELKLIIDTWDKYLADFQPRHVAMIDAEHGAGTVSPMRDRMANLKVIYNAFEQQVNQATFWQKVSLQGNELSAALEGVRIIVRDAQAEFAYSAPPTV